MGAFEKACPQYLVYGMTFEQYWDGDVKQHRLYKEAHRLKMSESNTMAWLQGRYIYDAMVAVSPIIRAFSKAKRPQNYVKEPYDLDEDERKRREDREERKRYEKIKEKVAVFAAEMKRRRENEGKEENGNGENGRSGV